MSDVDAEERAADVLRLRYVEGEGVRAIAKKLSMSRRTVRRLLGQSKTRAKKPIARVTVVAPFEATIRRHLEETPALSAPAMLERLRVDGYTGGITALRDRMRLLRPRPREAFLKLDFLPGEVAQVDWADFGFALPGIPRRVSAFVMTQAYSRYLFLEFTLSQQMGTFLRSMEAALRFFGGVTQADIFDGMKTVVIERVGRAPIFHPRFAAYAAARGFSPRVCTPRKPNQKGRVERPIGFVRSRFWPGRRFRDLADLNAQAIHWRDTFANRRVHDETGKVPELVFLHEEKAHLRPVPETPFDTDDVLATGVTRQHRVAFDRNDYTVPWRLVGQSVLARADESRVSVWLGPKQVAAHVRCWEIAKDIRHPSHEQGLREIKRASGQRPLPLALDATGEIGHRYFEILVAGSRSLRRETERLVLLIELFGVEPTASAMQEVLHGGHVGAEYVEYVLRHKRGLSPSAPPLRLGDPTLDEIALSAPDLSFYDQLPTRVTRNPDSSSFEGGHDEG